MPATIISLPNLTLTSSAVNSSTQTIPAVDISDALAICGFVNGNTTAPGLYLEVAFSTESTAAFAPLVQISPVTTAAGNGLGGSTGAIFVYVSSHAFRVPDIAAKQLRIASSGVTSTGYTIVLAKQVHV